MAADGEAFLEKWHGILANKDMDGMRSLLAEDMTMGAPPYWNKLEGIDVIHYLLGVIISTIEDFTYYREWVSGSELCLEFRGHIGDRQLQGVDLITINDDGLVSNLDVMIRPMSALVALKEAVRPQMEGFGS